MPSGVFDRVLAEDEQFRSSSTVRVTIDANGGIQLWGVHGPIGTYESSTDDKGGLVATPKADKEQEQLLITLQESGCEISNLPGEVSSVLFSRRPSILRSRGFHWISEKAFRH